MVRRSYAVTIRDVARQAGVSAATVSRYLNRSAAVAPETGERIQQAMRILDYSPRLAARSLATRKTFTVGVISNAINYAFFGPLLWGMEDALREQEYRLLMATYSAEKDGRNVPFGPQNTDGVVVFANAVGDEQLMEWYETGFPCVLMYRTPPADTPIPCVKVENKESARALTEHLIKAHGKRRIAFIHAPDYQQDGLLRESGYREALRQHGLPYDTRLVLEGKYRREQAYLAIQNFLVPILPVCDAVVASDDDLALTALGVLYQAGVAVPEQVAVVGFDDQRFAASLVPPLTTVRAPTEMVGRVAAQQVLRLIQGKEVEGETVLPTSLVVRRSCGCPARNMRKDLSEFGQ